MRYLIKKVFIYINSFIFCITYTTYISFAKDRIETNKINIQNEKNINQENKQRFVKFKQMLKKIKKNLPLKKNKHKIENNDKYTRVNYTFIDNSVQKAQKKVFEAQKNNTNQEQTNSKKETTKIENTNLIKKYIIPAKNPAFGTKKNSISIAYGYDIDRLHHKDRYSRHLHVFTINYSAPFRIFGVHGRYSIGLFALYGKDQAAIKPDGKYHHIGVELFPEFVFGNKNVYITAGCGMSYVFYGGPMTYLSRHKAEASGIKDSANVDGKTYDGMTYYNWVLKASIGHIFDNGMIVEIIWKHYSNGGLGQINYDVNAFGINLGYAFSLKI